MLETGSGLKPGARVEAYDRGWKPAWSGCWLLTAMAALEL